jgi:hypothetical protein
MKTKAIKWLNAQITDEMSKGDYDIVQYLKGLVNAEKRAKTETADESEWRPMFEKLWSIYPRKVAKAQAVKTFAKKVKGKSTDELKDFCNKVWRKIKVRTAFWEEHETDKAYICHFSSFLNNEFE